MSNMTGQALSDGDLEKDRCTADHDDSGHDLKNSIKRSRTETDAPNLSRQRSSPSCHPIGVIICERGYGHDDQLGLRISRLLILIILNMEEEDVVLETINDGASSSGVPIFATHDEIEVIP